MARGWEEVVRDGYLGHKKKNPPPRPSSSLHAGTRNVMERSEQIGCDGTSPFPPPSLPLPLFLKMEDPAR